MNDLEQKAKEIILASDDFGGIDLERLEILIAQALAEVREEDAKVCDKFADEAFHEYRKSTIESVRQYWLYKSDDARSHAAAIRKGGE
jgi:hypothetical protein